MNREKRFSHNPDITKINITLTKLNSKIYDLKKRGRKKSMRKIKSERNQKKIKKFFKILFMSNGPKCIISKIILKCLIKK